MPFAYLDVCAGLSAPTAAWADLGALALAYAEIDPFASAVLAARYGAGRPRFMPDPEATDDPKEASRRRNAIKALDRIEWGEKITNEGDFTRLRDEPFIVNADVLVGGTPCQAFSLAGLRRSLADDRGNLTLEFVRLFNAIDDLRRDAGKRPCVALWENVPGVLNTDDNAFGAFLGGLVGSESPLDCARAGGWTDAGVVAGPRRMAAWRTLDAQHFGLAQRRRRVFVLSRGYSGDRSPAEALLPILDSVLGHPTPSRQTGAGVARSLTASAGGPSAKEQQLSFVDGGGRPLNDLGGGAEPRGRFAGRAGGRVAGAVSAKWAKRTGGPAGDEHYNLVPVEEPIPYALAQITHPENRANPKPGDPAPTLTESGDPPTIVNFEHGLAPHGSLELKDISDEITASEGKGHSAVVVPALTTTPYRDRGAEEGALVYVPEVAATITNAGKSAGSVTGQDGDRNQLIAYAPEVAGPLLAGTEGAGPRSTEVEAGNFVAHAFSMRGRGGENQIEPEPGDVAPAIRTAGGGSSTPMVAVAFQERGRDGERSLEVGGDLAYALTAPTGGTRRQEKLVAYSITPISGQGSELRAVETDVAPALDATSGAHSTDRGLRVLAPEEPFAFKASHYTRDKDGAPSSISPPLTADADKGDQDPLILAPDAEEEEVKAFTMSAQSNGFLWESDVHPTLMAHPQSDTSNRQVGVRFGASAVRRLTPRECERLQGYADDFTLISYSEARRSEEDLAESIAYLTAAGYGANEAAVLANTPDGPRYRALGNSMATTVIEHLGRRIVWLLEGDA